MQNYVFIINILIMITCLRIIKKHMYTVTKHMSFCVVSVYVCM